MRQNYALGVKPEDFLQGLKRPLFREQLCRNFKGLKVDNHIIGSRLLKVIAISASHQNVGRIGYRQIIGSIFCGVKFGQARSILCCYDYSLTENIRGPVS